MIFRRKREFTSTVARYLQTTLQPVVDDNSLGAGKPLLRGLKLRPFVIERLDAGHTLTEVMRSRAAPANLVSEKSCGYTAG